MGQPSAPTWEIGSYPPHHLVASRAVVSVPPTRRGAKGMLVGLLALCLLLPATGSASSGSKPRSADAAVTHAKKKRKKKRRHARCKHYRKVRVKRGHRRVTVRRCVHKKKKQSSNQQVASGAPTAIPPVAAGPPGFT